LHELRTELLDHLSQLLHQSKGERFDYVEQMLPSKDNLETQRQNALQTLQIWTSVWRDAMQKGFRAQVNLANPDRLELIGDLIQKLNPQQIHTCVQALQRTQRAIEQYANVRLAMEVLMLELPYLGKMDRL